MVHIVAVVLLVDDDGEDGDLHLAARRHALADRVVDAHAPPHGGEGGGAMAVAVAALCVPVAVAVSTILHGVSVLVVCVAMSVVGVPAMVCAGPLSVCSHSLLILLILTIGGRRVALL